MGPQQETIRLLSAAEARADISDTYTYTSTTNMPHNTSLSSSHTATPASYVKYGSVEDGSSLGIYGHDVVRSTLGVNELSVINMTSNYVRTDSE